MCNPCIKDAGSSQRIREIRQAALPASNTIRLAKLDAALATEHVRAGRHWEGGCRKGAAGAAAQRERHAGLDQPPHAAGCATGMRDAECVVRVCGSKVALHAKFVFVAVELEIVGLGSGFAIRQTLVALTDDSLFKT